MEPPNGCTGGFEPPITPFRKGRSIQAELRAHELAAQPPGAEPLGT